MGTQQLVGMDLLKLLFDLASNEEKSSTSGVGHPLTAIPLPIDALREVLRFVPLAQLTPLVLASGLMAEAVVFVTNSQRLKVSHPLTQPIVISDHSPFVQFLATAPGVLQGYTDYLAAIRLQFDTLVPQVHSLAGQFLDDYAYFEGHNPPYLDMDRIILPSGDDRLHALVSSIREYHARLAVLSSQVKALTAEVTDIGAREWGLMARARMFEKCVSDGLTVTMVSINTCLLPHLG